MFLCFHYKHVNRVAIYTTNIANSTCSTYTEQQRAFFTLQTVLTLHKAGGRARQSEVEVYSKSPHQTTSYYKKKLVQPSQVPKTL